jgi:hypothetical protein
MWQCSTSKQCSRTKTIQHIKAIWQCSISKLGFVGPKWLRKKQCSLAGSRRRMALWARGGRWCCELKDGIGSTASWALGHHGDDGIAGSGRTKTLWAHERCGSMASWAWGWRLRGLWCHRLRSRKMAAHKGALTMVGNNGAEAPRRTRWWHGLRGGRQWCKL